MAKSYTLFDTRLGTCALAWSDDGIERVMLPEANKKALESRLERELGQLVEREPPPPMREAVCGIVRHLAGQPTDLSKLPLALGKQPPFRRKVYRALRRVSSGDTVTYGELAARAGSPGAARAVGQAMAQNPFPLVVPCHRVLAAGGKPGGYSAHGGATTKARILALEGVALPGEEPLFAGGESLPFDGARAVRSLRSRDRQLAKLMKQVGSFELQLKRSRSTFASLAEAIVYQQLSGKAAASIFARLRGLFPGRDRLRARDVADAGLDKLRSAGLSKAKALALEDLAAKAVAGKLPPLAALRRMDDESIIDQLTEVRGVGRWTAEMLLIFQLGRPDVLPVNDLGVRKGFALAYGRRQPPQPDELARHGERWRPYRTVASWYFWRALEL